jgi:putative transposase
VRLSFVEKSSKDISIRRQCALLCIPRSTFYYKDRREEADVDLMNLIRDIWLKYPFYGYRKITKVLGKEYGLIVNKKRVLRLMQLAKIASIYPKPNLSKPNRAHAIFPYLLKGMSITRPNQVWMTDITYLKLPGRFVYLVALIDVYSRYIVGWSLSFELDTENCMDALEMALKGFKPEIVNSDQGCQFTSELWVSKLKELTIKISMDGKGRCLDNVYIERFWRSIKYEAIYLNDFGSYQELYIGVKEYIDFYNEKRPHQSLNYAYPKEIFFGTQSERQETEFGEGT